MKTLKLNALIALLVFSAAVVAHTGLSNGGPISDTAGYAVTGSASLSRTAGDTRHLELELVGLVAGKAWALAVSEQRCEQGGAAQPVHEVRGFHSNSLGAASVYMDAAALGTTQPAAVSILQWHTDARGEPARLATCLNLG